MLRVYNVEYVKVHSFNHILNTDIGALKLNCNANYYTAIDRNSHLAAAI